MRADARAAVDTTDLVIQALGALAEAKATIRAQAELLAALEGRVARLERQPSHVDRVLLDLASHAETPAEQHRICAALFTYHHGRRPFHTKES